MNPSPSRHLAGFFMAALPAGCAGKGGLAPGVRMRGAPAQRVAQETKETEP